MKSLLGLLRSGGGWFWLKTFGVVYLVQYCQTNEAMSSNVELSQRRLIYTSKFRIYSAKNSLK